MADSALSSAFVQAKNYTPDRNVPVDLIVVHDMEYPERLTAAEDVAKFFANQAKDPPGGPYKGSSAHYNVDADSIVGSVHESDVAWHAPGGNHNGIGIEHAGYASQRAEDWADAYSDAELRLSSRLAADIAKRHSIPIVWLSPADLLAGKRGITSHNNVTLAFKRGNHTDPGPNFPVEHYVALVRGDATTPAEPTPEDYDDMPLISVHGKPEIYMVTGPETIEHVKDESRLALLTGAPPNGVGLKWHEVSQATLDSFKAKG